MASTTFVNYQTVIDAGWLNDVNSAVYSGTFQASTITPTNVTSTGAISGATVAGTTSVTTPIVKSGTSLTLQTNGSTAALTLDTSQNATFAGKVASAGSLQLATNGTTTAVTIDTAQNVGVGVTPSAWSGVKAIQIFDATSGAFSGSGYVSYTSSNCYYVGGTWYRGGASYGSNLYSQFNGQHNWNIAGSGSAGSAISFTQAMTLDSSGNLTVPAIYTNTTASVTYVAVSSAGLLQRGGVSALKYKQNVRDLESIDISKFRAVRYNSKCENDDQTKDHFGFIADEVLANGLTELITYGETGEVEGFQYERMCVVLLKNAQEQQLLITNLQTQITALKDKVGA